MQFRSFLVLPLLALGATGASAQNGATCRDGLFAGDPPFALVVVNGASPAYFRDDGSGCPWSGAGCRMSDHLAPGDPAIINGIRKGFACVSDPRDANGAAGWIELDRLDLPPVETNPPLSAWLGRWVSEGNRELSFEASFDRLAVSGRAAWPRADDVDGWTSAYDGEIDGTVVRTGHLGEYRDDHWRKVKFTLLGDYLVASGVSKAGGPNASFAAIYRRVAE